MEPASWLAFHYRHFSKKVGGIQWLQSGMRPQLPANGYARLMAHIR
jgi:hypothetical protein